MREKNQGRDLNSLRYAMRREAGRVWHQKEKAEHLGLFMNEETITETLLLRLAVEFRAGGLVVRPFTKAEETKNGADWEFWGDHFIWVGIEGSAQTRIDRFSRPFRPKACGHKPRAIRRTQRGSSLARRPWRPRVTANRG